TFTLKYTVDNAITLQRDTAELYWQWIGDEWEQSQSNIHVTVNLPAGIPDQDIQAWAHGPTTGTVSIPSAKEVTFQLAELPKLTFFEGRILVPKDTFSAKAGAPGSMTQAQIKKQEDQYIQDTIARAQQQRRIALFFGGANILFIVAMIGFFLKSFVDFWQHHKEKSLPKINQSGTLWEPPSE